MITNAKGKKTTPKDKAKEILSGYLQSIDQWTQIEGVVGEMTDGEITKVNDQLEKIIERVCNKYC